MTLPESLQEAIRSETQSHSQKEISAASFDLSDRYRTPAHPKARMQTKTHRLAYLSVRMPATFEADFAVLSEIKRQLPHHHFKSILDLGAGPGTASWAAVELFPEIQKITLVERDSDLIQLGQRLASHADHDSLKKAEWIQADLAALSDLGKHDLVILSYVIGELSEEELLKTIESAWRETGQVIVIIEPGTPKGYEKIIQARTELIQSGGHLVAPCPHALRCPMLDRPEWCHFSVRFERSKEHRQIKEASLGYEDEKYSYISAARNRINLPQSRIVGHPSKHSGHLFLPLCTPEGIKDGRLSRRDGDLYRLAKKASWGDPWP